MRKVIILSGISGSGKTTYVKNMTHKVVSVVSADHYFMKGEEYQFDASKLSLAHGECFKYFIKSLQLEDQMVVVDNTNTTEVEIAPYMLAAQAFGYAAEIITLRIPVIWAHERNIHNIASKVIESQFNRLLSRKLPPWWKKTILIWDTRKQDYVLTR